MSAADERLNFFYDKVLELRLISQGLSRMTGFISPACSNSTLEQIQSNLAYLNKAVNCLTATMETAIFGETAYVNKFSQKPIKYYNGAKLPDDSEFESTEDSYRISDTGC